MFEADCYTFRADECSKIQHTDESQSPLEKSQHSPIQYYSAGATASYEALLKGINGMMQDEKTVSGYLGKNGVTLYRTIANQKDIMADLVQELALRRIKNTEQVVILSEWDTFYARAMPEAFKTAILEQ